MALIACYVGDLRIGGNSPAIDDLTVHAPAGAESLGSAFLQASGPAQLNVELDWSLRDSVSQVPHMDSVNVGVLTEGLEKLLLAGTERPAIGLLLADFFDPDPSQYGMMFDLDMDDAGIGPRQGCAVFVGGIQQALSDAGHGGNDDALREFVAYTAVHEIGHAFNLWHIDDSYMQPSPTPGAPGPYQFVDLQRQYLALAANSNDRQFVLPGSGCSDYGQRPDGWTGLGDDDTFSGPQKGAAKLSLRIALSHRSFYSFEPVELAMSLALQPGQTKSVTVPSALDPGFEMLRLWITDPAGERRRFRSPFRFCRSRSTSVISRSRPLRRDVFISRQRGGNTFQACGTYQVQAAYHVADGTVVLSNIAECEVLRADPTAEHWRMGRQILESKEGRRLLRFKSLAPTAETYDRLTQFARKWASEESAAAIDYALGMSLLSSADLPTESPKAKEQIRRRALKHLQSASRFRGFSAHRRQILHDRLSGKMSGKRTPSLIGPSRSK